MNANECISTMPAAQPLTERIVTEVFAALRSAEAVVANFWRRGSGPSVDPHAYDSIARLDERTLRDIGAPNWLVAQAAERREAQALRWVELDVR